MKKIFLLLCVAYIAMSCEHENEKYTAQYIRNETKNRIKVTFYLNDSIKWDGIGQLLIDGLILLPGSMSYGKDTKLVDFFGYDSVVISKEERINNNNWVYIPKIVYTEHSEGKNIYKDEYWIRQKRKKKNEYVYYFTITNEDMETNE